MPTSNRTRVDYKHPFLELVAKFVGGILALSTGLSLGDNDTLSANVASTIGADLLVLLSDIDGLYDADPHKNPNAKLIDTVERLDERIFALAGGEGSSLGTGGMVTKLRAAKIATEAGCEMVIANGSRPEVLYDIMDGRHVGTRFLTQEETK